jgi:hypothetical protein
VVAAARRSPAVRSANGYPPRSSCRGPFWQERGRRSAARPDGRASGDDSRTNSSWTLPAVTNGKMSGDLSPFGAGGMPERMVLVVEGRVVEVPPSHRWGEVHPEGSRDWYEAVALLGGMLLLLGAVAGESYGGAAAVAGFTMFLATAVLAGLERYEWATAVGVAAVVWTVVGISEFLGIDRSPLASFVGTGAVGALTLGVGLGGTLLRRAKGH